MSNISKKAIDISKIVEEEEPPSNKNEEFNLTNEMDQKLEGNEESVEESSHKKSENSVNYENLEEKKKTGFFSMLSSLMTSDKKITEVNDNKPGKKQKTKKTKTDPNLFLFNDVVNEESAEVIKNSDDSELSEISDISEFSSENETIEDIDTPSYLRKGSNQ